MKLKTSVKYNVKRIRRHSTEQKIFTKDKSDEELLSKIDKELLKPNNKKTTTQLKKGPKTLTVISPKKIYSGK